ncbi:DUF6243 family protein [Streptomyces albidoflavus]|uniref:DUF6243 family protein n=1 Tax=Streptomyces TaxID=1883 RepID=UPI000526673A|nr:MULTISPECIES: DUF6243 family protein [Streptomyces]PJT46836.1 hypothetical protein CWI85_31160 [Streptomyces albidoflavus]QHC15407.1 hypothetical protein GR131_08100 [Streptomyces sp. GF20]
MAKSRNNLLGVGGQRNKLPRNGRPASAPGGAADNRPAALDQKQELLRKMRERTAASADTPAEAPEAERDEATQEPGANA